MKWKKTKDKFIIIKDGVYFSLTTQQLKELKEIIIDIDSGGNKLLVCDSRGGK